MNQFTRMCMFVPALGLAAFLFAESPATKPTDGEEVTTASGLTYVVTEPSDGVAMKGDTVRVHYAGRLTDGKEFDNSFKRGEPIQFPLGEGHVIKGWDEGIAGMKVGEKRQLTIPPELAYGEKGAGDDIPPNATLIFDVELVGIRRQ